MPHAWSSPSLLSGDDFLGRPNTTQHTAPCSMHSAAISWPFPLQGTRSKGGKHRVLAAFFGLDPNFLQSLQPQQPAKCKKIINDAYFCAKPPDYSSQPKSELQRPAARAFAEQVGLVGEFSKQSTFYLKEAAQLIDRAHHRLDGLQYTLDKADKEASRARLLLPELQVLASITELDLTGRSLRDAGARVVADALKGCTSLRSLSLRWNGIREQGAAALATAVQCSSLRCLDLFCNSFGDRGAAATAAMLPRNATLQKLDLGWNSIGDRGAAVLAAAMKQNTALMDLGLEQNAITGATALAEALVSKKSCIRLAGNPLEEDSIHALERLVETGQLGSLDLWTVGLSDRASLSSELEEAERAARVREAEAPALATLQTDSESAGNSASTWLEHTSWSPAEKSHRGQLAEVLSGLCVVSLSPMGTACGRAASIATNSQATRNSIRKAQRIAYVCDVEGHWDFFCNFVELCDGVKFKLPGNDGRTARTSQELELELADGWLFVFGGDACDKGPGTLRFLEAMVMLKRKYPARVFLILGNRDLNKMRWTSELTPSELKRIKEVPRAFWQSRLPGNCPTHWEYLRRTVAQEEGLNEDEVTERMIQNRNTKANKLRYMLDCDMGSVGDFEFRREELAHLLNVRKEEVTDEDVVESYERSVAPGGVMRKFLNLGQLALLIDGTLFVHGQIIGNQFPPDQVLGADDENTAWSLGVVPGEEQREECLETWIAKINSWAASEIRDWQHRPQWEVPPKVSTFESWSQRGASELIAYGTPGTRYPTVIYCRYLTEQSMPLPLPDNMVEYLKQYGVKFVVVGHTPHGNAPTVIMHDGVTLIMGDTSFSDVKANRFFQGDNRGTAACSIEYRNHAWFVHGQTDKDQAFDYSVGPGITPGCDPLVGRFTKPTKEGKQFFVKAKLKNADDATQYLLSHVQGFRYEYAVSSNDEVATAIEEGSVHFLSEKLLMEFLEQDVMSKIRHLFHMLDMNDDGTISMTELVVAINDPLFRRGLRSIFPTLDPVSLLGSATLMDGELGPEQFHDLCKKHADKGKLESCIYFPMVVAGEPSAVGAFPKALPNFHCVPTKYVQPGHLTVFKGHFDSWFQQPRSFECDLSRLKCPDSSPMSEFCKSLKPHKAATSCMSAIAELNIPEAERRRLKIPAAGQYFAWSYPFSLVRSWKSSTSELPKPGAGMDPDVAFLTVGGFVYFDDNYQPVHINAAVPDPKGRLRFGPPSPSWAESGLDGSRGAAIDSVIGKRGVVGAVPEDLRKLLEDVLGAVRQVAEEGDRADEVKQALAPLQQLLHPQRGDPNNDCQDPDLALARAFKTQAGVLRALGQRKLQGEHRVTQARAALQNHEWQLQQLQEELVQAQVEMDRLAKQYSDQIVARQLEPYGAGPMEDEGDMGIDSEMQDNIKALQGALQTDEQKQMLESLLRKCAHADLQHKRRKVQAVPHANWDPDAYEDLAGLRFG
ncbi:NLRC3 [Symbiodinium sp. KB8]|nr:NLRC3 [Symbiodinium sp. KB8]